MKIKRKFFYRQTDRKTTEPNKQKYRKKKTKKGDTIYSFRVKLRIALFYCFFYFNYFYKNKN
jgi:hypothetical protein